MQNSVAVRNFVKFMVMFLATFSVQFAMAGGGLDEATNQANELKTWLYGLLGTGVFLYLMYNVIMALANRIQWAEVGMAVVYVAIAGGVLVLGSWAWGIWGS